MSGLLCAGDLFIDQYVNGAATGNYIGPLNATKVAIDPGKGKDILRPSYQRTSFGAALDTIVIPEPAAMMMTIDDLDPEILQLVFRGAVVVDAAVSGTVTAEILSAVSKEKARKLARRDISSVVVKNQAGSTTYVLGTDYTVDLSAGMITPTLAGAITEGSQIQVAYAFAAVAGKKIAAGTLSGIQCRFYLNGINLANNKKIELTAHKAVLSSKGDVSLIGDKFAAIDLGGSLVIPVGGNSPYEYRELS
jgi:hypothetical protein